MKVLISIITIAVSAVMPVQADTACQDVAGQPQGAGKTGTHILENDSVNVSELDEIVIEGNGQYFTAKGAVYTPTASQKNSSFSAVDLIDRMGIPQLNSRPDGTAVSDKFGNTVPIFINYVSATPDDINGLRTSDVVKVQYLENSDDPRFGGEQKVVNILVRTYEYGGYTKLYVSEHILAGLASEARVNSKFSYRKMTYDIYLSARNWNYHHDGTDSRTIFRGVDAVKYGDDPSREQKMRNGHLVQEQYPVSFRAIYGSDRMSIRNTVGYNFHAVDKRRQNGTLKWIPSTGGDMEYSSMSPEHSNTFNYNGYWQFSLPGKHNIIVSPSFTYGNTNGSYRYETDSPMLISRESKDKSYHWTTDLYWFKKHRANTFQVSLSYEGQHDRTCYVTDRSIEDIYDWMMFNLEIGYWLSLQNLTLSSRLGYNWSHSRMSQYKEVGMKPYAQLSANYRITQKHSLQAYIRYDLANAPATFKSNETFQLNELLFYTGNPYLSKYDKFDINLGYGFIPGNRFSMYVYGRYRLYLDKVTTLYEPYLDGKAIRRRYVNDGTFSTATVGIDMTCRLLNRSLQLSVNPEINVMRLTGDYSRSLTPFTLNARASYYIGEFYVAASYRTRSRQFDYRKNATVSYPDSYSVSGGWGNGIWSVRLSLNNIFRTDWKWGTTEIDMPDYYDRTIHYGQSGHGSISLNVAYTFGYGRRINRDNELNSVERSRTAILE